MAQTATISIIDFYGNRSTPEKLLRQKISFREGDSLSFEQMQLKRDSSVNQLQSIHTIKHSTVCSNRL
jgi:outer membrane protein assembly factor BamA